MPSSWPSAPGQRPGWAFPAKIWGGHTRGSNFWGACGRRSIVRRGDTLLRVEIPRCLRVFDEKGRFSPVLDNFQGLSPTAESVVVAIGQRPNFSGYLSGWQSDGNLFLQA